MKVIRNFLGLLIIFILIITGCCKSNKLDRKLAYKIISEKYGNPTLYTLKIPVGKINDSIEVEGWGIRAMKEESYDLAVKGFIFQFLYMLDKEAIIKLSCKPRLKGEGSLYSSKCSLTFPININLTEKGRNLFILEEEGLIKKGIKYDIKLPSFSTNLTESITGDYKFLYLKMCEKAIVEVAGIRFLDRNNAIVEYIWKYDNFSLLVEKYNELQPRMEDNQDFIKIINLNTSKSFSGIQSGSWFWQSAYAHPYN